MKRPLFALPVLLTCFVAGCRGAAPSKEAGSAKGPDTKKDVIVLSPAEQAAG